MVAQTVTYQKYEAFKEKQNVLADLIKRHLKLISSLNMTQSENSLQQLETLVQSNSFKVLVLGEFKRGKSTFINALLGEKVLPAYARPCTAIINEVKWGDSRRALLHPAKSADIPVPQPQEVPVNEIEEYVVIKDDVSEINSNPYEKVELFWPLELCRNKVEIIDSPGLNEHDTRQKVTMDYLSTVDAILFILSCEALASKSEMDVIDNTLRPAGHEDIFFICNRFNMIEDEEKDSIKQHGIKKLAPKTKRGAERVFFIDARGALGARLKGDIGQVESSGLALVERELEKFLANEKGNIKILRSAAELQRAIYEAREVIPQREAMLRTDFKTLEARYEAVQEPLHRLQIQREQIVQRISNFLEDIKQTISAEGSSFYRRLADKIVSEWVKTLEIKTPMVLTKSQIEKLIKEVTDQLSHKMENELLVWQNEILQPLVSSRLERLTQEIDERANEFVNQLDSLKIQVAGSVVSIDDLNIKKVSVIERVLAASGGFLLGANIGLAGVGAVFGYQEMAKAIIPQLILTVATITIAATNPLMWFAAMASGGVIQGFLTAKFTSNKIKEEAAKRFAASIRDSAPQRGDKIAEAVVTKLAEIQNSINQGLGQEIQNFREQVDSILEEKQQGQANVDATISELQVLSRELDAIDQELDALVARVAIINS
ncbi:GTP-binding protein [Hassallia byssoidea VB512170]|uniref:GTP-binding protein n=1 Tax=Hassallia byssoidea VB512170 TaxID=1304833 RepID=A0A846H774_9CYAN|nr:dynamin family protein [Hassalia byssoidea]NEU73206.1 GTP-binding protein [Hassalia byssoidea VB512170]